MAARIFMWCCRRVQRRGSEGSANSGEGPDGGEQQGKKSGRRSFFTRPLNSNLATKKKKKGDKDKPEDGVVGDLSVVRRETEVLRPYQKPPPPKNRARASRVPRALKNHNAAAAELDIFQELNEADVKEGEAPIPSTPKKAAASGGDGDASTVLQPLTPSPPPDQPDTAPNTAAAAAAESGHPPSPADAEDSQDDHLSNSEKDTAPKCPNSQVVETAAVESVPSAAEDAESSPASPQKAADTSLSDSAGGEDVPVKPDNTEPVPEQNEDGAFPKAAGEDCSEESKDGVSADQKSEDSLTEPTKDEASPAPQKKDSGGEESKGDKDALSGGDEDGGDDEADLHQDARDSLQLPDDSVSVDPSTSDVSEVTKTGDCSDASNTTAGDSRKVPRRPASYSEYSSSSAKSPAASKGKRFPVPSVHEEGMDQLMDALQKHLKEEDISVGPADQEKDQFQKSESSEPWSAERAGSQSDAGQPEDVEGDTVHPTSASQD